MPMLSSRLLFARLTNCRRSLADGEGGIVTIETKQGELLRGFLFEAEDSMNMVLKKVTRTDAKGRVHSHDSMYIRGTSVIFVVLPDILRNAPMFKRIKHWREKGGAPPDGVLGGGQTGAILRKAQMRSGGRGGMGPGGGRGGMGMGGRGMMPMGGRGGGGMMGGRGMPMHGRGGYGGMPPPPGAGYGGRGY